jgi:nitronate monooxygenase
VILDQVQLPIVLAPLGGGPSTPELAAAVTGAGGLGFLATGYLSAEQAGERIERTRRLTAGTPFGVNLFVPPTSSEAVDLSDYLAEIQVDAESVGARLGEPRHGDDDWARKLDLLCTSPVPVVSFTFGLPSDSAITRLHAVGSEVWVTVTSPSEARAAATAGADVLVVQGIEAGGHTGGVQGDPADASGLLALLQRTTAVTSLPLVAAGGIATGAAIAAVLSCGATAAALGTAFLDCPEAGTSQVHREALRGDRPTALTRAFTGRTARGIRNEFMDRHTGHAPKAYPEIHYATAPMRATAREQGDAELVNLWAGQAYALTRRLPAGDLVRLLADEARVALAQASRALHRGGDPT